MTNTVIESAWAHAPNLSADAAGSIHDDAKARSFGFQATLVGGSVLSAFLTPVLVDRFERRGMSVDS